MNEFYTIEDIANMLGVERHTASRLVKTEMVYIPLSKKVIRVRKVDFEAYLEKKSKTPAL